MALDYASGAFVWVASDPIGTLYTVSGLSFQPKALRFVRVYNTNLVDGSGTYNLNTSIGFATSPTNRVACGVRNPHNMGVSITSSIAYDVGGILIELDGSGTITALLDLDTINTDGFVAIVDNMPGDSTTVFWEAWGGTDITVAQVGYFADPSVTGNQDYTVTGFLPDDPNQVVMFSGGIGNTDAQAGISIGYATSGEPSNNIVVTGSAKDNQTTSNTRGYCQTGECIASLNPLDWSINARAQLTQFNVNGFRLNWLNTSSWAGYTTIYLAIKGGSWQAGSYTIAGNTSSATATVSGLNFTPKGLDLIGRRSIQSTNNVSTVESVISIGMGTSVSNRKSTGFWDQSGLANMYITHTTQYDQVLCFSSGGALQSAYDINAMNSNGFEIIVDVAGGVANEWQGYLAFGNTVPGQIVKATFSLTPSSIGLKYHQRFTISSASFSLTPDVVGYIKAFITGASTANFALTSNIIASLKNYGDSISDAAFLVTPSSIGLLFSYRDPISGAAFTLTSNDIGSLKGYRELINGASFIITSDVIRELYHIRDINSSANFIITPNIIRSIYNIREPLTSANFLITSNIIRSLYNIRGPIDSVEFIITPSSIDSIHQLNIVLNEVVSASFELTPSLVKSLFNRRIYIDGAVFNITPNIIFSDYSGTIYGGVYNAAGYFPSGSVVTIILYDPITGNVISLNNNSCVELGMTGLYVWDTSKLTTQPDGYKEYVWIMTDGITNAEGIINMGALTIEEHNKLMSLPTALSAQDKIDIASSVGSRVISGALTADQSQRVSNAILFGKVTGAGTGVEIFRNPEDTKNVCSVTVDNNGNRSLVVLDVT